MSSRVSKILADEVDRDSYELLLSNKRKQIERAEEREDVQGMLKLAGQIIELVREHDDSATEEDLAEFERRVLRAVAEIKPGLVDEEDLEEPDEDEEDEEDEEERPRRRSKKRRGAETEDQADDMEPVERDAFGRRVHPEHEYSGEIERDVTGRRMDPDLDADLDDIPVERDSFGRRVNGTD